MEEFIFSEKSLDMKTWKSVGKGGFGGFGEVFKARHLKWKWDMAIKIVGFDNRHLHSDEDLLHDFKMMRRAENPYVMRAHGVFRGCIPTKSFRYTGLVMDLMDRGSINSLLEKLDQLPWPLVFRLAHQVALGMNYLHSLKPSLIHGDLKPVNVLLDPSLNVKITNFGLAEFTNNFGYVATNVNPAPGTPFFMPPEAFDGARRDIWRSCSSDVYSYAMLVFVILNMGQKVKSFNVKRGERPSLEAFNRMRAPGLEELVQLMKRCWHQDPDSRPFFSECTPVTEDLYGKHKSGIDDAVYEVLKKLDE